MKSLRNIPKMRRMGTISNAFSVGGLFVLLAGVLVNFFLPAYYYLALGFIILGGAASVVGIYFANRWVKKPRPEDTLDAALKGMTNAYRFYHYPDLPYDHVLLTPEKCVAVETVNIEGDFLFDKGKWKEQMTVGRAVRWIVEEHLGNPIKEAQDAAANLSDHLAVECGQRIPVEAMVVFVHPRALIKIKGAPILVCTPEKFKTHIGAKGTKLSDEIYARARTFLDSRIAAAWNEEEEEGE
jgi:hypothetical protein